MQASLKLESKRKMEPVFKKQTFLDRSVKGLEEEIRNL